ncbi:hypothetical protein [Enterobacter sp.]|nr:hypothetical protein [Enterobacter sp.]
MSFKIITLALASSVFLTACQTRPVSVYDAPTASQSRVFQYQKTAPSTLVVIRDSGMLGSGCYASIFINGQIVAKLNPNEKASFQLDEGDWIIGASLDGLGLCGLNPPRIERETRTKAGETKVLRVSTGSSGFMDILPTTL